MQLEQKRALLQQYFTEHHRVVLGFSGGVDSAFLLAAAKEAGADITPVFIHTPFQPAFELEDARRLTGQLGIRLEIITANPLQQPEIVRNDAKRCYWCKHLLFSLLKDRARELNAILIDGTNASDPEDDRPGMQALRELGAESPLRICGLSKDEIRQLSKEYVLIDGTNASDPEDDRPGMQALRELGAESPLRICGLSKDEIRQLSKEYGLFTWDKPSYACLATRIPTGTAIDCETLQKVEKTEDALFRLGFSDFRVRVFHGAARIQLLASQWQLDEERRRQVTDAAGRYFDTVLLDMTPRTSRE